MSGNCSSYSTGDNGKQIVLSCNCLSHLTHCTFIASSFLRWVMHGDVKKANKQSHYPVHVLHWLSGGNPFWESWETENEGLQDEGRPSPAARWSVEMMQLPAGADRTAPGRSDKNKKSLYLNKCQETGMEHASRPLAGSQADRPQTAFERSVLTRRAAISHSAQLAGSAGAMGDLDSVRKTAGGARNGVKSGKTWKYPWTDQNATSYF